MTSAGVSGRAAGQRAELSEHVQVNYLLRLLEQKGRAAAKGLRERVVSGEGIMAKGQHFRAAVVEEALQRWSASQGLEEQTKASPKKANRPPATPQKPKDSPPRAKRPLEGAAAPEAKERRRSEASPTHGKGKASPSQGLSALPPLSSLWAAGARPSAPSTKLATGLRFEPGQLPKQGGGESGPTPPRLASAESPASGEKVGAASAGRLRRGSGHEASYGSSPGSSTCSRSVPSADSTPQSTTSSMSVSELKSALSKYSLDFSSCVEKAELQALWSKFEELRAKPITELRALCLQQGAGTEFLQATADACARLLLKPAAPAEKEPAAAAPAAEKPARNKLRPMAAPPPAAAPTPAPAPVERRKSLDSDRAGDALQEARRILAVRRTALWGFQVLDVPLQSRRDVAAVQRCYRLLMKKLHPDKVGDLPEVAKAIELIREAKDVCERGLSRTEVPGPPRALRYEALNVMPGSREFKLHWHPPAERDDAPVQRYIVAALDPAYGKPLTVTVLEPDYSQEEQRYVTVEELNSYVLAEKNLQKMPSLWTKDTALLHVAAANDAGQSAWAKVTIRLTLTAPRHSAPTFTSFTSAKDLLQGEDTDDAFEEQLRSLPGTQRKAWLEQQKKASLASWLKSMHWPTAGSKDELIKRVMLIIDNQR